MEDIKATVYPYTHVTDLPAVPESLQKQLTDEAAKNGYGSKLTCKSPFEPHEKVPIADRFNEAFDAFCKDWTKNYDKTVSGTYPKNANDAETRDLNIERSSSPSQPKFDLTFDPIVKNRFCVDAGVCSPVLGQLYTYWTW